MSFDPVAPFYRALETAVFGRTLQKARVAFMDRLDQPRRTLIVGEGNGRFLEAFTRRFPDADIDCFDSSAAMLRLARTRAAGDHVQFIHADFLNCDLARGGYDWVVTHFFLDCFGAMQLPEIVRRIDGLAAPNASWLIADFAIPNSGVMHFAARALIAAMYLFFRITTGIRAHRLTDYRPLIKAAGFRLVEYQMFFGGIVTSERWQRS
jgi:ubiquinone/menaquinone biosynthesis C-methylase UbiE